MRKEFSRGKDILNATLLDGSKVKICNQLKYGQKQVYWYYVQCKGWKELDLRSLVDAKDIPSETDLLLFLCNLLKGKTQSEIIKILN